MKCDEGEKTYECEHGTDRVCLRLRAPCQPAAAAAAACLALLFFLFRAHVVHWLPQTALPVPHLPATLSIFPVLFEFEFYQAPWVLPK